MSASAASSSLCTPETHQGSGFTEDSLPHCGTNGNGDERKEDPFSDLTLSKSPPIRQRRKTNSPLAPTLVSQSPPSDKKRRNADLSGSNNEHSGVKKRQKKASSKQQDKEDMSWICAECKEADCGLVTNKKTTYNYTDNVGDSFLICDGPCRRIFHVPCAGLAQIPDTDDDWLCKDCLRAVHACAYCSQYGRDNIDVFPCQDDLCGLYFHEACLQTHYVDYSFHKDSARLGSSSPISRSSHNSIEDDEDALEQEPRQIPLFTCPAHHCWTCTQKDMIQLEKEEQDMELKVRDDKSSKKNKRKKKTQSIFQSKPGRLFQCLYCPTSYHVTCIPPAARFHELAILCHEHAMSHRLPDLDMSMSIQSILEDRVEQTLMRMHGVRGSSRRKKSWSLGRGLSVNPFFPGLRGDRFDSLEEKLLYCIKESNLMDCAASASSSNAAVKPVSGLSMVLDGSFPFCLPVDIKNEVYSKPPPYTHIQSLKYDTDKSFRPKRINASNSEDKEKCSCTGNVCGDDCFNRLTMTECTGPNNCNLGGKDCGNRALGKRQFVKCQPKRERGKGWGLVTLEFIPKGKVVQEYMGEVIDEKEKEKRLTSWSEEHPNDPNFYVMALSPGYYVDAREYANFARFINHSCDPNCKVASINVKGYIRNGIYSIRDIRPGEFLSYDYHFDTKHGDRFVCRCGATNCRGTMKGLGKDGAMKMPASWKEAKARYEADKKFLEETEKTKVVCLVDTLLPCAEHPNETIASGPLQKHRRETISGRIFLWRNLKLGADFVSRYSRLEKGSTGGNEINPRRGK